MDLDALATFAKIAELKSLAAVAKLHDLPKSTMSLKLRQLESEFGLPLFSRDGRSLMLTDAGAELLRHARQILAACDHARSAVAELRDEVAGTLRVGSTGEFGTALTAQMLCSFRKAYPLVKLEVVLLPATVLLAPDGHESLDAILSWDDPGDSDELAEPLSSTTFGLYASPAFLKANGTPASIADLRKARGITYRKPIGVQSWRLKHANEVVDIVPKADLVANEYWTLKYFAVAGEGIAYLPRFFTRLECARNHLVPVMPEWQSDEKWIHLLVPRHAASSRKIKAFIAFCTAYFTPDFTVSGPAYFVENIVDLDQEIIQ
jgi:DNA-binding transcriptional LysR family regulator